MRVGLCWLDYMNCYWFYNADTDRSIAYVHSIEETKEFCEEYNAEIVEIKEPGVNGETSFTLIHN